MPSDTELLVHLYDRFNARDMEAALAIMREDVVWANGLSASLSASGGSDAGVRPGL